MCSVCTKRVHEKGFVEGSYVFYSRIWFFCVVGYFVFQFKLNLFECTVWMKSLTVFSGALHLLHYYKINLANLLTF